jgi:hypothetical protein
MTSRLALGPTQLPIQRAQNVVRKRIRDVFSLLPGFSGKSGCVWWLVSFKVNEKIPGSAIVRLTGEN